MINVLINGAYGKMGTEVNKYISTLSDVNVKYEVDRDSDITLAYLDDIIEKPDVIIDFSIPKASLAILDYATCHLIPVVIATTGFTDAENSKILEYSQAIPIFKASNMSYNIHSIGKILKLMSPLLSDMDIEIIEKHHKEKKDAPSGTALFLADEINSACNNKYTYIFDRHISHCAREKNEIGFSSVRGGNVIGEHEVLFLGENESIEIKHTSYSRRIYAEGAVLAARFIINKKNGLYSMSDLMEPFGTNSKSSNP